MPRPFYSLHRVLFVAVIFIFAAKAAPTKAAQSRRFLHQSVRVPETELAEESRQNRSSLFRCSTTPRVCHAPGASRDALCQRIMSGMECCLLSGC